MLAPGERADWIVDFSGRSGQQIVLQSYPFPLLQFRVGAAKSADTSRLPAYFAPGAEDSASRRPSERAPLALIEQKTMKGESMSMLLNNTPWHMPVTENPALDSVEIWSFINTTEDSHPIHLHLVRFQILDRRSFEPFFYQTSGEIRYTGPGDSARARGVRMEGHRASRPGMVTRIIVRFEGYVGRYVWHCHVLEHEDNEMMRPYDVIPAP